MLRVHHAGRDPQHRCRERALAAAGLDVTLVVPSEWHEAGAEPQITSEPCRVLELPVHRAGDVNRHRYVDPDALRRVIDETKPDVLDIHEEPFSLAARQWLEAVPHGVPVAMYTAQNIDKRFPPPFCGYERVALRGSAAFYSCSLQAASVVRGKGFGGPIEVLPLGYDDAVFRPGLQSLSADEIVLMLVGRLVPEKGIDDAVHILRRLNGVRPTRLVVSGRGAEEMRARRLAATLGVADRIEFNGWLAGRDLASAYRSAHIVLVPSQATATWAEQFGRVIVEAQASRAVVAGYSSGAIPEVGGEAAIVVPVGDVEMLAERVARLVVDPVAFDRLRDAGLRQAATRTWQVVAGRQLSLYQRLHAQPGLDFTVPRSPRNRRLIARSEFGPTASTPSGVRPFALPVLRRGGRVTSMLASAIDATVEIAAHVLP